MLHAGLPEWCRLMEAIWRVRSASVDNIRDQSPPKRYVKISDVREVLPDAATILDQNHSSAVTRCRDHGLLEGARDDSGYWCLTVKGLLHCIDKFGIL